MNKRYHSAYCIYDIGAGLNKWQGNVGPAPELFFYSLPSAANVAQTSKKTQAILGPCSS